MRKSMLLGLAGVSSITGCENPFTHKPFLDFQASKGESRQGTNPIITIVPIDATYALMSFDNLDRKLLATVHLSKGDRVGFQREREGLVAVAGQQNFPVSDGTLGWVILENEQVPQTAIKKETNESMENLKKIVAPIAGVVLIVSVFAGVILGAGYAHGDLNGFQPNLSGF